MTLSRKTQTISAAFLEPNLAFSLASYDDEVIVIRVHFSLESLPPWEHDNDRDLWEWFIPITTTATDLQDQASNWRTEIRAFPQR